MGKDSDAGEEKTAEMVTQHHPRNGHEAGQTLGDGRRQGSLAWCCPWGGKELDMTWQLNKQNIKEEIDTVMKKMKCKSR